MLTGLSDSTVHHAMKRKSHALTLPTTDATKATLIGESTASSVESHQLITLENHILQSRKHYNNITKLIELAQAAQGNHSTYRLLAVSLSRIFSRLLVSGTMKRPKEQAREEKLITDWIVAKFREYRELLLNSLRGGKIEERKVSLKLLMHLTKEEAAIQGPELFFQGRDGIFSLTLKALVTAKLGTQIRTSFVEEYVNNYGDIRLYTFRELA